MPLLLANWQWRRQQFYTFYICAFCLFMRFIHDGPIYVRSRIYHRVQQANEIAWSTHLSCGNRTQRFVAVELLF